jgi:hypothetical protein
LSTVLAISIKNNRRGIDKLIQPGTKRGRVNLSARAEHRSVNLHRLREWMRPWRGRSAPCPPPTYGCITVSIADEESRWPAYPLTGVFTLKVQGSRWHHQQV